MSEDGHIELERAVDSIVVGVRHRTDLGDLTPLKDSIERLGVLQPITIAPNGTLLCGRRRLEAIRQLQWQTVKVWVRSGLSDELNSLLAQQDDNLLHKPLSLLEAASLYRELEALLAEDAARRQRATRFGATGTDTRTDAGGGGSNGGGESPPPSRPGKTRNQAARMLTGSAGYKRLEQVNQLDDLAGDQAQPTPVRELAGAALGNIRDGGPVNPWFKEVTQVRDRANGTTSDDELDRLAQQALERIKQPRKHRQQAAVPRHKRSTRAFVHTWTDMDGWSTRHDATEIGETLTEEEWTLFERVLHETNQFHDTAQAARATSTPEAG